METNTSKVTHVAHIESTEVNSSPWQQIVSVTDQVEPWILLAGMGVLLFVSITLVLLRATPAVKESGSTALSKELP